MFKMIKLPRFSDKDDNIKEDETKGYIETSVNLSCGNGDFS